MKIYENLDINDLDREIWKTIKDFPDYQVSNFGRVKRKIHDKYNRKLKILKQFKSKEYLRVSFFKNGKIKHKSIHIIIFESFNNCKLKNDECIHHIDKNRENNYYKNLKLMSKKKHNSLHKKEENKGNLNPMFGSKRPGEISGNHKLLEQDVYDIRKSLELKLYTPKQLSWMFDVSVETISLIKNKKRW